MDLQLEQRINIKFLVKLGKNSQEIYRMLHEAYGEDVLKERTVRKWTQRFREGRQETEDDSRSGRPSTSRDDENVQRVLSLVLSDRRVTVRLIAEHSQAAERARASCTPKFVGGEALDPASRQRSRTLRASRS